jgi:hypothetical protein
MTPAPTPAYRYLRGYAFDPSLSLQSETVEVNTLAYKVEWEDLYPNPENKKSLPSGEYIEIIDYDPATGVFYPPVDLNDMFLLASDGLEPSVSNPQFHQQMVYAVAMTTIKNFERALGRKILWSDRLAENQTPGKNKSRFRSAFVRLLRIYPHALRQANAYYHPDKKAILFGYFPAKPAHPGLKLPGETVFTCLSHDVIAHETTHAILDGLHRRYIEPTHPDTRAFHEGFADLVALFQHFTFPDVLKHQIAKTRGNLISQNLLGQLALEFGRALGHYGSLRDAIGETNPKTKEWVPHIPDPSEYQTKMEFHDRGAILVAAVFEAFLTLYKQHIQRILRIGTGGSGVLPAGELHPDLVNELANIASKTARQILGICVRALDYCPPVDVNFGDYLRALITADMDMVAEDEHNYRVAFIEAFQKRGIFPRGLKSMSVEVLAYAANPSMHANDSMESIFTEYLRDLKQRLGFTKDRETIYKVTRDFISGSAETKLGLHARIDVKFLRGGGAEKFSELTGLLFPDDEATCKKLGLEFSRTTAKYQVGNLWLASRVTPSGEIVNHVILTILQKRGVVMREQDNDWAVAGYFVPNTKIPPNGFIFRGGCTLIFDLDSLRLKYAIVKRITDTNRMVQQFRYTHGLERDNDTYFSDQMLNMLSGPFAFMHNNFKPN